MDGKTFAKFAKDCQLISKKLTATEIDLIFAKVKSKALRKINIDQFYAALELCAEKKDLNLQQLEAIVLKAGGPVFTGT